MPSIVGVTARIIDHRKRAPPLPVVDSGRPRTLSAMPRVVVVLALALPLLAATFVAASDVALTGVQGHPRDRFPLAVHFGPSAERSYGAAARRSLGH